MCINVCVSRMKTADEVSGRIVGEDMCRGVIFKQTFFFQAEDGIRDLVRSRGLGDVYERRAPLSATALAGDLEILVPMAGIIDVDAELARLDREIDKIDIEAKKLSGKLSNPKFADNAPAEVVAKERQKLADFEGSLTQLQQKRSTIAELA